MANSSVELSNFQQKRSRFRGSAKIKLRHLVFENDQVPGTRPLDQKNVARLLQVFDLEGCLRLEPEHYVPAIISEEILAAAIQRSRTSQTALMDPSQHPLLIFPAETKLTCLHGKHRVVAANEFLLPGDKWWVVDLYADDLSKSNLLDIREDYCNARNFCDGDIYRNLRFHQIHNNKREEGKWLARLSKSKRRNLKQLREKITPLSAAFDKLLPFIGLWSSLQLGALNRVLALRCPEELVNCLSRIYTVWSGILDGKEELMPLVDSDTVNLLQMRFPAYCSHDRNFIEQHMRSRQLFPAITEENIRAKILDRLRSLNCMIPSLYTFFEDTIYLEPCALVLRGLLPEKFKGSVRDAIMRRYTGEGQEDGKAYIQESEGSFRTVWASEMGCIESGYHQLWLFAMRHWPELTGILPRKDTGKSKPKLNGLSEEWWPKLGCLAYKLGFDSTEISKLRNQDPDWIMADSFWRHARPQDRYPINAELQSRKVQDIYEALTSVKPQEDCHPTPKLTADLDEAPYEQRCGKPYDNSQQRDSKYLFLGAIHMDQAKSVRERISSFAVKREFFLAFFGHNKPWIGPVSANAAVPMPAENQSKGQGPANQAQLRTDKVATVLHPNNQRIRKQHHHQQKRVQKHRSRIIPQTSSHQPVSQENLDVMDTEATETQSHSELSETDGVGLERLGNNQTASSHSRIFNSSFLFQPVATNVPTISIESLYRGPSEIIFGNSESVQSGEPSAPVPPTQIPMLEDQIDPPLSAASDISSGLQVPQEENQTSPDTLTIQQIPDPHPTLSDPTTLPELLPISSPIQAEEDKAPSDPPIRNSNSSNFGPTVSPISFSSDEEQNDGPPSTQGGQEVSLDQTTQTSIAKNANPELFSLEPVSSEVQNQAAVTDPVPAQPVDVQPTRDQTLDIETRVTHVSFERHIKGYQQVKTILDKSTPNGNTIYLFLFEDRQVIAISNGPRQEGCFMDEIRKLVNEKYYLAILGDDDRLSAISLSNAWGEAVEHKVIFSGKKCRYGDNRDALPFSRGFSSLLSYYDNLDKRKDSLLEEPRPKKFLKLGP